jgi:hypothetical protein
VNISDEIFPAIYYNPLRKERVVMEWQDIIRSHLGSDELFNVVRALHDSYQPFLLDCQVWDLLERVIPYPIYEEFLLPCKKEVLGHQLVNDIVMNFYFGEKKVKYHLSRKYMERDDEISTFEFNVGASRLDFARLNGYSYAYEIKTELDSLDKLDKQLQDYSAVFEFLHVVCHPDHYKKVIEIIPEYCGVITYNTQKAEFPFSFRKKRLLNPDVDPRIQLTTLTSKELDKIMKRTLQKSVVASDDRHEKEQLLLEHLSKEKINHLFKEAIKQRFCKRWQFVKGNIDNIQPIDLQSFFKSTADPRWVYYKNSSMV